MVLRNRRLKLYLLIGFAVLLVAAVLVWTSDDTRDVRIWGRLKQELSAQPPENMELYTMGQTLALTNQEAQQILSLLKEAKFRKSSRSGATPTPLGTIRLLWQDGRQLDINYLGEGVFALTPYFLDEKSQFFIWSSKLENYISSINSN